MKLYEMVFQVTPWESHQELYSLNSKQSRAIFFNQIVKENQRNIELLYVSENISLVEANFLMGVYTELNVKLNKMKHKFIETGGAMIDCYTFIKVLEHDFSEN